MSGGEQNMPIYNVGQTQSTLLGRVHLLYERSINKHTLKKILYIETLVQIYFNGKKK